MQPDAEVALLRRALDGDLEGFNGLVELYQRAVFNLCLRMLGSPPAAEDAAQDAFLSAYRSLRTFRGSAFRPWLMRIAANACTDELRRRGRRPALSLDAPVAGSDDHIDVPDPALGSVRMTAPPPRLSATPAAIHWTGPALGQHNGEVYGALGLDAAELEALRGDGII